jgi:hypothetical protein
MELMSFSETSNFTWLHCVVSQTTVTAVRTSDPTCSQACGFEIDVLRRQTDVSGQIPLVSSGQALEMGTILWLHAVRREPRFWEEYITIVFRLGFKIKAMLIRNVSISAACTAFQPWRHIHQDVCRERPESHQFSSSLGCITSNLIQNWSTVVAVWLLK